MCSWCLWGIGSKNIVSVSSSLAMLHMTVYEAFVNDISKSLSLNSLMILVAATLMSFLKPAWAKKSETLLPIVPGENWRPSSFQTLHLLPLRQSLDGCIPHRSLSTRRCVRWRLTPPSYGVLSFYVCPVWWSIAHWTQYAQLVWIYQTWHSREALVLNHSDSVVMIRKSLTVKKSFALNW